MKLHSGDTIIFSATPIPGNERAVNETVDRLYQIGATVITTQDAAVHASGHGWSEEIKLMLNLTRPKYVMPIHGDHKRLYLHGLLAEAVGVDPDDIFRGRNGLPLEIDESGARFGEQEQTGVVFVDGVEVGDIEDVALRDRRALSADGIFIVVATVSGQDGRPLAPPEVIQRGVPFLAESDGVLDDLRQTVEDRSHMRPRTRSTRSHCSRSTCARTWRRSSTTACAGGRWCCRWWSRSSRTRGPRRPASALAQRGLDVAHRTLLHQAHEHVRDVGVELRAGVAADLLERDVGGQRGAVRARRGHRVEGVAAADDARLDRDLLALQPVGVARAVPALVRGAHDAADLVEEPADALQHPLALDRVRLHHLALVGAQRAGLVDDLLRHRDLADVVQQRGELGAAALGGRQAHLVRDLQRERDDGLAVEPGVLVVVLDQVAEQDRRARGTRCAAGARC